MNAKREGLRHPIEIDESAMPALDWECPVCEEPIAEWDDCPYCGWNPYPEIPDMDDIALCERNLETSIGN